MNELENSTCQCLDCPGDACTCGCQARVGCACKCGTNCQCGPGCECDSTQLAAGQMFAGEG
jgi:hypothetical protein